MSDIPNPITRKDQYLSYLTGNTDYYPTDPITREERYLYYLCVNGIGGGGGTVTPEQIQDAVDAYLEENPVSGMTEEQEAELARASEELGDIFSMTDSPSFEAGFYQESEGNAIENNTPGQYSRTKIDISKFAGRTIDFSAYIASNVPCFAVGENMNIVQKFTTDSGNPNKVKQFSFKVSEGMAFLLVNTYDYPNKIPSFDGIQKNVADWILYLISRKILESDLSEELKNKINSSFSFITPIIPTKNRIPVVSGEYVALFLDNLFEGYSVENIQAVDSTNVAARIFEKKYYIFPVKLPEILVLG